MNQTQTKKIKGFYDKNAEFTRNERYSDESQTVYTRPEDRYHWLVFEPKTDTRVEVRQTDEHGMITARDSYEAVRNAIQCVGVERLRADHSGMVQFCPDEINLLYQFGENGKEGTLAMLSQISPRIKDEPTKAVIDETIRKLSSLAPDTCFELISSTKNRKLSERDTSIRERLARAKTEQKQPITTVKNQNRKREQSL